MQTGKEAEGRDGVPGVGWQELSGKAVALGQPGECVAPDLEQGGQWF